MRSQISTLAFVVVASSFVWASPANAQTQAEIDLWDTTWATYQALEAIPLPQRGVEVVSQDLTVIINAPINDVFDIYSNVNNALGLHPFLVGLTPIRHTNTSLDFIALEDIPLGDGTVFHATTVAQQRFNRKKHFYDADTYDAPGIVTHQHITFTKIAKGQTQVVEHLTFEAPAIYITTVVQGGVYAHLLVQQGLKAAIEAGAIEPIRFPEWLESGDCHGHHGRGGHGDDDHDDD